MIGVLFHGPEVFDGGWAAKLMRAFPRARFMLAGTMSRTALHDSGLKGVETPGLLPSACLKLLARDCSTVLICTNGKNVSAGFTFGRMVCDRAALSVPVLQAECSGQVYAAMKGIPPAAFCQTLEKLGFALRQAPPAAITLWRERGLLFRSMNTAEEGDFVLVDGIVIGRAIGGEVAIGCKGRRLLEARGVKVKPHGLEKLERLGGVDLASAKLASTGVLRAGARARVCRRRGKGVVFIDHASMHVYELAGKAEGAVTVGDDTTAVAGDILRRFGVPVIGITDGDGDGLHKGKLSPGSVTLTVKADDKAGLRVRRVVFRGRASISKSFAEVKSEVMALLRPVMVGRAVGATSARSG